MTGKKSSSSSSFSSLSSSWWLLVFDLVVSICLSQLLSNFTVDSDSFLFKTTSIASFSCFLAILLETVLSLPLAIGISVLHSPSSPTTEASSLSSSRPVIDFESKFCLSPVSRFCFLLSTETAQYRPFSSTSVSSSSSSLVGVGAGISDCDWYLSLSSFLSPLGTVASFLSLLVLSNFDMDCVPDFSLVLAFSSASSLLNLTFSLLSFFRSSSTVVLLSLIATEIASCSDFSSSSFLSSTIASFTELFAVFVVLFSCISEHTACCASAKVDLRADNTDDEARPSAARNAVPFAFGFSFCLISSLFSCSAPASSLSLLPMSLSLSILLVSTFSSLVWSSFCCVSLSQTAACVSTTIVSADDGLIVISVRAVFSSLFSSMLFLSRSSSSSFSTYSVSRIGSPVALIKLGLIDSS